MTSTRQIEANRLNGKLSTGPRTANGKAIARRNSLKHGLCANPAAGVVENAEVFNDLLAELTQAIQPANPIEAGLVHTIAVSIFRQQRAALIDSAIGGLAINRVVPDTQQEVQGWIERIGAAWRVEQVEVSEGKVDSDFMRERAIRVDDKYFMLLRSGLLKLDALRGDEMMPSAAAITAMMVMLGDLEHELTHHHAWLRPDQAEQLAWLLGEYAIRFPVHNRDSLSFPDERRHPTSTDALIGRARTRRADESLPSEVARMIANRLISLRQQRDTCAEPFGGRYWHERQTAALLPDRDLMDRLLRYEIHADRRMYRALEMLAKLRGVTVETIMAQVTATGVNGATYQVEAHHLAARRERRGLLAAG